MRSQNPPEVNLEHARRLEQYLRATTIVSIYAVAGALCVVAVTLAFSLLLESQGLRPTRGAFWGFAIVAGLPVIAALVLCLVRPRDPISAWLRRGAEEWRRPLELCREECVFKEMLGSGDSLRVGLALHYPMQSRTPELEERLYLFLQAALVTDCSARLRAPTVGRIEQEINTALEIVAKENSIPVLYSEVLQVTLIREDLNLHEEEVIEEIWRTGT